MDFELARIMSRSRRRSARIGIAVWTTALVAGTCAPSALGSVTIGQLAPGPPATAACVNGPDDLLQPEYVVPAGGVAITSWSTTAAAGAGQQLKMKVLRKIAEPARFQVVASDGPRSLTPSAVNTFNVNLPVQPGDVLGLNDQNASTVPNACLFDFPGGTYFSRDNDLPDGQSDEFFPDPDSRVNVSAVVGFKPENDFSFGGVKRNKRKGTATLTVDAPGPGTVSLTGKGVQSQRNASGQTAVASKKVTEAGPVKLRIKAKGSKKRKLNDAGKVKVKVKVTFTPDGSATGDVVGDPKRETKRVRLVKL